MRIRVLTSVIIFLLSKSILAQDTVYYPVSGDQLNIYMGNIRKASASLTTLQSTFTQKKNIAILSESVVSKGILLYKKDNMLSWEYSSPYYYLFVLNGDKVFIKTDKSTSQFDTKSNALFKEISVLLVNSISGAGLIDPKKFDAAFYESSSVLKVKLSPKNKSMKSFLSNIILYFDKKTYLVKSIEMIEPMGDMNTITFNEVKLNQPIGNEKFLVH